MPEIEASQAYKDDGAIILWWDETEGAGDASHRIPEIIISPDAKGNAYTNNVLYTHSSDLLTMKEIYGVGPCLRGACSADDLSDLFKSGAIPKAAVPEPSTGSVSAPGIGLLIVGLVRHRRPRG